MKVRRIAGCLLLFLVSAACLVLFRNGSSYSRQDRDAVLAGSSREHLAGTDMLGRDRLVRTSAAFLLCLFGAAAAAAISTIAAGAVGIVSAFSHSTIAASALLVCDVFLALPWLFLLMMVRSSLPLTTSPIHSAAITFLVLAALGWPACAHAVYRGAVALRNTGWMLHARASGLRWPQRMRHLVPNLMPLLVPQFLVSVPAFVMAEANLGALGLGVGEPMPSWGGMLLELDNSATLVRTPWVWLPVGLLISILLLLEAMVSES
jgi:ABC-type dipeptide/oligopeptide/nickel transport system permease subunit